MVLLSVEIGSVITTHFLALSSTCFLSGEDPILMHGLCLSPENDRKKELQSVAVFFIRKVVVYRIFCPSNIKLAFIGGKKDYDFCQNYLQSQLTFRLMRMAKS